MPSESEDDRQQGDEREASKETAGDILRAERIKRGLSEKEVADKLHITMHYVKALEANTYEKLPGAVFAKGYIKSYAVLLELEVDDLFSLYNEYNEQLQARAIEASRQRARRKKDRNKPWVVLSLLVFVGGFTGLWVYNSFFNDDPDPEASGIGLNAVDSEVIEAIEEPTIVRAADQLSLEQMPEEIVAALPLTNSSTLNESPPEQPVQEAIISAVINTQLQTEEPLSNTNILAPAVNSNSDSRLIEVAAGGTDILRISFSGESWIEVNDNTSSQIYRDIREKGDVLEITGNAPFSILLGDAPFANMSLNGVEVDVSNNIRIDNSARLTVGL